MDVARRQLLTAAGGGTIFGAVAHSLTTEQDTDREESHRQQAAVDRATGLDDPPAMEAAEVFLIGGQSNATGHGSSEASIPPPEGAAFEHVPHEGFEPLVDPVGTANTGSAWPAFADAYWAASGRYAVYVPASVGGTSVHPAANDNWWGESGGLLYRALGRLRSATVNLQRAGITPRFGGLLWHQGETDAHAIDEGRIEPADYRLAFETMIERYRLEIGDRQAPMSVFQLGRRRDGETQGFQELRRIQRAVAAADPNVEVVFEGAVAFPAAGKMKDMLHYNQAGLNEMGRVGGRAVAETGRN
ncbi:MAG: sialate O-acetylesterase [Euryarchaeota archaeon]|nr:sialate O-acetylesterase [Euryarchaeota archaeon]